MSSYEYNQSDCCICREPLANNFNVTLPCNHVFHTRCLNRYIENDQRCPTCRVDIPPAPDDEEDDVSGINLLGLMMNIVSRLHVIEEGLDEIGNVVAFYDEFTVCSFCGSDIRKRRLQTHVRKCIKSFPINHLAKHNRTKQN